MYKNAIVVPGFSETTRFAEGLAREAKHGDYALAKEVDIAPLGDVLASLDEYDNVFRDSLVITHSAGIVAVRSALGVMTLNGPEPTTLRKTIKGAVKIAFDKNVGAEDGISMGGLLEPALELARHPILNARIPFAVRTFSTLQYLLDNKEAFNNCIEMYTTTDDQFGFTRPELTAQANYNGIFARVLTGKHNHAMFQPANMLQQIHFAKQRYFYN